MKYMGSKQRYAKEILPITLARRESDQWWVEPFVGGFNLIDKVKGKRLANDSHFYLIEMFRALQRGYEFPEAVSVELYKTVKTNPYVFENALYGFVGFGCSYSGKWWGGYARDKAGSRNYCAESKRNLDKQRELIADVQIENTDYRCLDIPKNSVVYLDPPYCGTTSYGSDFNHTEFWCYAEGLYQAGHTVFVSEYAAPDAWECVWQKRVYNTLTQNTGSKAGVEKLFTYRK